MTIKIPYVIETIYPLAPTGFLGSSGVVSRLNDPGNLALNNAAAHDQTLAREDAQAAWALGDLGNLYAAFIFAIMPLSASQRQHCE